MAILIFLVLSLRSMLPAPWARMEEPRDSAAIAIRVGLTPNVLAAAGCDDVAASSILTAIENAAELTSQLWLADEDWAAQAPAVTVMANQLRGVSGADEALAAKYVQAAEDLQGLESSIAVLTAGILQAALAECSQETAAKIESLRHGASAPALPLRVSVLTMTDEQRDELGGAYAQVRWAAESGEEIDPKILELVSDTESEPAVIQAQADLDSKLDEVDDLFDGPG